MIAAAICRKFVCADLADVRKAIKKVDRSTTADGLTLDLIGHCNGSSFSVGGWMVFDAGDATSLNGLRGLRNVLRQKNVTSIRFLGCSSAVVRGLLDAVSEALNAGVAADEEIMVSGTREKLNYRHFNAAGLKCSRESVLYRRKYRPHSLRDESVFQGVDVTSARSVWARRDRFGGAARWEIHRVDLQSVKRYVERLVGRERDVSVGMDHLLLPDVEYVFCLHEKNRCDCSAIRSFSLSFGKRYLAYRAAGQEVILQYRRPLPILAAQR